MGIPHPFHWMARPNEPKIESRSYVEWQCVNLHGTHEWIGDL